MAMSFTPGGFKRNQKFKAFNFSIQKTVVMDLRNQQQDHQLANLANKIASLSDDVDPKFD